MWLTFIGEKIEEKPTTGEGICFEHFGPTVEIIETVSETLKDLNFSLFVVI